MKLAIITPGFLPVPAINGGAVEQLITDMIMSNENHPLCQIDLYTVYSKELKRYSFKHTNLIMVHDPQKNILIRAYHYLYRKLTNCSSRINYLSLEIMKNFKRHYYDVVLVENNMDIYRYLYALKTSEKFYFHLHNDFDNGDSEKSKDNIMKIINTANGILVVSNYLKKKLLNYGAKKVNVIYNFSNDNFSNKFFNSNKKNEIRKYYGIKPNDNVFSYIGRLSPDKGIDKLLKALCTIKHLNNVKFLIIGNYFFHSKEEIAFKNKIENIKKKCKQNIIFTGYIDHDQLPKIYAISDCIIVPTQVEEAFGMVALEAMKMQKAVIATNSGALPEILSPKGSIIINKNNDFIAQLAKVIVFLTKHRSLQLKMGKANYLASKKFTYNNNEYFASIFNAIK